MEVFDRFVVGVHALFLRVGYEDHPIHPAQDQPSAGIVKNLAWDRIEVKSGFESAHGPQLERQKIKEEGPVGFGCKREHFAPRLRRCPLEDPLQVGGFAAESCPVIHDLAVDFAGSKIDKTQIGWSS